MNPVRLSLRYPQVTIALTMMLVACGAYALLRMPRREDPKIHVRTGIVAAFYPGASASEVENQVTQKIERRLFKIEGVRRELAEETGIDVRVRTLIEVFERIDRDPSGKAQYHFVVLDYLCEVVRGIARAGSDVSEVAWAAPFELEKYSLTEIASRVIRKALDLVAESRQLD